MPHERSMALSALTNGDINEKHEHILLVERDWYHAEDNYTPEMTMKHARGIAGMIEKPRYTRKLEEMNGHKRLLLF